MNHAGLFTALVLATGGVAGVSACSSSPPDASPPSSRPTFHSLAIPFDSHRHQVAVTGTVGGEALSFLVDTAVTPSVVDLATAERLGLPVDRAQADEAQGVGSASARIYPSEIRGLRIAGVPFEPITAAAMDLTLLAERYGKPLHGVLGQSFLENRILLIDYSARTIHLLSSREDLAPLVSNCRRKYQIPLQRYKGSTAPVVQLRVAGTQLPATLDTGGSGTIEFMTEALPPGAAEGRGRQVGVTGARGDAEETEVHLQVPVFLGPFRFDDLPVTVSERTGSPETRQANIGNALLQNFRLFVDYRANRLGLFSDCNSAAVERPNP